MNLSVLGSCPHERRTDSRDCHQAPQTIETLRASLNASLCGKGNVIEMVIACLLARGHILLEDLPGLGKTTLAKALAHAVGGRFARVQCTPDLLPSDVTGFNLFNQKVREFEFLPGPVFADVLLADEINRATPRTQSAAPGGDVGAAGHRGQSDPQARRFVPRDCHAEPDREPRHIPATRGPA